MRVEPVITATGEPRERDRLRFGKYDFSVSVEVLFSCFFVPINLTLAIVMGWSGGQYVSLVTSTLVTCHQIAHSLK